MRRAYCFGSYLTSVVRKNHPAGKPSMLSFGGSGTFASLLFLGLC